MQYPGLQSGGALDNASTPGTPAGSIAASAHGGTYSHDALAGGTWGGERGATAATAAAAARRRRAMSTGRAVTPPCSAPTHVERGGRHGSRAGGWDQLPRDGAPLIALLDGVRNSQRAAATETAPRQDHPWVIAGASNSGSRCTPSPRATRGRGRRQRGRRRPGPETPVAGQSFSAT